MKIFISFLFFSFLLALLAKNGGGRWRPWLLLAYCLFLSFAYFFLRQL
jgi:hypothetical protein